MTKRALVLQNYWDDPAGYLGEIMQEYAIAYDTVEVDEAPNLLEVISHLNQYDAIISLGGPQHAVADDTHPYLIEEKALIRQAVEQDIPYLGVCLGGQLLALALDAPVTRHTMTEIGFFEVQLTEEGKADPLFHGLPEKHLVYQWHMDTFAIPAGAIKLETSENTSNQAFRFGHRAYGLQYHIELTPVMLDNWLNIPEYQEEIIQTLGSEAPVSIERQRKAYYPLYREHARTVFENFLKIGALI